MTERTPYTIRVRVLVEPNLLDFYDKDVAGTYLTRVSPSVNPALAASYALDIFHISVAISELENFEIDVLNDAGESVLPDEEPERCIEDVYSLAEFIGKL